MQRPFTSQIEAAHTAETDETTRRVLEVALQAIAARAATGPLFDDARAALDFLVADHGFEPPVAINGPVVDTLTSFEPRRDRTPTG